MKTIVLTRATSGVGKEVARQLLQHGHRVISYTRDSGKTDLLKKRLSMI